MDRAILAQNLTVALRKFLDRRRVEPGEDVLYALVLQLIIDDHQHHASGLALGFPLPDDLVDRCLDDLARTIQAIAVVQIESTTTSKSLAFLAGSSNQSSSGMAITVRSRTSGRNPRLPGRSAAAFARFPERLCDLLMSALLPGALAGARASLLPRLRDRRRPLGRARNVLSSGAGRRIDHRHVARASLHEVLLTSHKEAFELVVPAVEHWRAGVAAVGVEIGDKVCRRACCCARGRREPASAAGRTGGQ